jgi:DNA-directed RNA polymerase subunit RPC12/RpoP
MPQYVTCRNCGQLLYKGIELRPPDEIIQQNGGYCPKCGKKLIFRMEDVKIIPVWQQGN